MAEQLPITTPGPRLSVHPGFSQRGLLSGIGQYDTGGIEGSPSMWGPGWLGADRSGSGPGGILNYTPVTPSTTVSRGGFNIPLEKAMFEGANKYENYAQAYPDLMHHYTQNIPSDKRSLADWAKSHWENLGQAEGRLGPAAFPASRYLPSMPEAYDPRSGVTETTYSAGVPMPDVEGYKYAYRPYEWNADDRVYTELAYDEYDISKYPYYPYLPTGGQAGGAERILAGVRLVPDVGQTGISTSSTSGTTSDTTSSVNPWETYVTRNQDLEDAYSRYLSTQDSSIVDEWELHGIQYGVGGMNENYPGTPMSKEQFGHAHWLRYGRDEGRTP